MTHVTRTLLHRALSHVAVRRACPRTTWELFVSPDSQYRAQHALTRQLLPTVPVTPVMPGAIAWPGARSARNARQHTSGQPATCLYRTVTAAFDQPCAHARPSQIECHLLRVWESAAPYGDSPACLNPVPSHTSCSPTPRTPANGRTRVGRCAPPRGPSASASQADPWHPAP